ncbi:MAG: GGDEF domain-containing protein [Lachnospiraceae bacterium]|nr:GGDEF domain-containing protein [Lachnospiraceae bacterium]
MKLLNQNKDYLLLRLDTIQKNSDDSFFDYDIKKGISHISGYGVENFNMPKVVENMPQSFAEKYVLPEDRKMFYEMYERMDKTKEEVHSFYRVCDGNGIIRYDEVTMIPVSDELAIGYVRDVTDKKLLEYQIEMMEELMTIEDLLISTHRDSSNLNKALFSLSNFLACNAGALFMFRDDTHMDVFDVCSEDTYLKSMAQLVGTRSFPRLSYLKKELASVRYLSLDSESIEQYATTYPNIHKFVTSNHIDRLYLLPIYEGGQKVVGMMGLSNPDRQKINAYFLKIVSLSFSRAYDNMVEQEKIDQLVSYDLSTQLLNRNKFIEFFRTYKGEGASSVGCVEFDVNGLHDYNTKNGHAEGDAMLFKVAEALRESFKGDLVFRTGGDEFVAICRNRETKDIETRIANAKAILEAQEIYVSAGLCYRQSDYDIEEMYRVADAAMYADKDRFYRDKRNKNSRQ